MQCAPLFWAIYRYTLDEYLELDLSSIQYFQSLVISKKNSSHSQDAQKKYVEHFATIRCGCLYVCLCVILISACHNQTIAFTTNLFFYSSV